MRRALLSLVAFAALFGTAHDAIAAPIVSVPPVDGLAVDPPPAVTAQSWILYDETYDLVLASVDPDAERAPASTTKIMTAIVALTSGNLDRDIVISANAADIGEAEVGLVEGETVQLDSLLTGVLVRSGNDAAIAIAEGAAGSVEQFVDRMNAEAAALGLEHTRFANPHGLDADGHYSSARDLLTMTLEAMSLPEFARAVGARVYRFPPDPDGEARVVQNTNLLLWDYPGAFGVKTGFTLNAGLVLVTGAERDGRRLYTVVMGSDGENAHFKDTEALLDYGFDSFGVVQQVIAGDTYGVVREGEETRPLTAAGSLEAFLHLAAAGVLGPSLELDDGSPVLVAEEGTGQVGVATGSEQPLPDAADAFGWFRRWFGDE
ncbi:MAG: D-alanyl-D-alanine carboxypeptidase [Acidimicrobiia bacterium]|nr:D-alanyl-D-alanine carboxypeptidase [Acidimicrobiia bacterium]MDH4308075.1 D-alanyl-D-alanine carboxypeptidase [Acidimicrobiia bacterium]